MEPFPHFEYSTFTAYVSYMFLLAVSSSVIKQSLSDSTSMSLEYVSFQEKCITLVCL